MKAVLITGVSTGIGLAAAKALVAQGVFVYGSVRRAEDAPMLGENFRALLFDVTDREALQRARLSVTHRLSGIVNNAGIAVPGPLMELPESQLRAQFEVNFFAPIAITKEFLPLLDPGSRILMVSSISGKRGYPFLGAYAASKHALEGASESLRRELLLLGIDVVLLCPGAIKTPIWNKASFAGFQQGVYKVWLSRAEKEMLRMAASGLEVSKMGDLIAEIMTGSRPRVRYTPVPGKLLNWSLPGLLPARWIDAIIARTLR